MQLLTSLSTEYQVGPDTQQKTVQNTQAFKVHFHPKQYIIETNQKAVTISKYLVIDRENGNVSEKGQIIIQIKMADEGGADKGEYIPEEINKAVEDAIMGVFQLKENEQAPLALIYNKDKVMSWSNQILDYTNRNLSKLQKPFKYIVTCFLQQNCEINFTMAMGAHCDGNTDGTQSIQKEINDIFIVVTVFGMLI